MNKFQLEALDTFTLQQLKSDVTSELNRRKRDSKIANRVKFVASLRPKEALNTKDYNRQLEDINASALLSIPWVKNLPRHQLMRYLPALLRQDWSHLFSGGDTERRYYVYAHVDPREFVYVGTEEAGGVYGGTPFYIGKGTGKRAFDMKRNQGHGKKIREILKAGFGPESIVKIIADGVTEDKALETESKLIYFFGTVYEEDRKNCILLNLDTPPIPEFVGQMHKYINSTQWGSLLNSNQVAIKKVAA